MLCRIRWLIFKKARACKHMLVDKEVEMRGIENWALWKAC